MVRCLIVLRDVVVACWRESHRGAPHGEQELSVSSCFVCKSSNAPDQHDARTSADDVAVAGGGPAQPDAEAPFRFQLKFMRARLTPLHNFSEWQDRAAVVALVLSVVRSVPVAPWLEALVKPRRMP